MPSQMFIITRWKHIQSAVDGSQWGGAAAHAAKNLSTFCKWVYVWPGHELVSAF